MKTMKRMLSLTVCLCMALTLLPAVALAVSEQFTLPVGGTYYFDLSGEGIPGTINTGVPDATLHYVPFTYAGTVNAYSLDPSSSGDIHASDNATASDRSLFVSEFVISHTVNWVTLDGENLIFGKTFDTNYTLRSLSEGNINRSTDYKSGGKPETNEWDRILDKNNNYIKNWYAWYSLGQDTALDNAPCRSVRGSNSARSFGTANMNSQVDLFGFRPALEVLNSIIPVPDGLKAVTLNLNGGMLKNSTADISIVCAGNSFKAPSATGLTVPSENVSASFISWNTVLDGKGTSYNAGTTVPNTVTTLYAQWLIKCAYNTPAPILQNGVTATVVFDKSSPQTANTPVTATVTLTGTAAAAGTHTINLNSSKANLTGTAQNIPVTAGQSTFTVPSTYTFTVPVQNVDDLTLTHSFTPDPVISISPSATFPKGNAPITTLAIGEGIPSFNATNNFDSVNVDGTPLAIGVNTVLVRDGSIILQFNPLYLNTLSVGTHTVTVALKGGAYAGRTVSTTLTVTQGAPVVTPPKTGDGANPMLWLGLMLLGGIGLIVLCLRKKQRA